MCDDKFGIKLTNKAQIYADLSLDHTLTTAQGLTLKTWNLITVTYVIGRPEYNENTYIYTYVNGVRWTTDANFGFDNDAFTFLSTDVIYLGSGPGLTSFRGVISHLKIFSPGSVFANDRKKERFL